MKTRILKNKAGWYDIDQPQFHYQTRKEARVARRSRLGLAPRNTKTTTVTVVGNKDGSARTLTALQNRLMARFSLYGLDPVESADVILNRGWGYHQAASYGHMRSAGATDSEATEVINMLSPDLSRFYGEVRALDSGIHHAMALAEAEFLCLKQG